MSSGLYSLPANYRINMFTRLLRNDGSIPYATFAKPLLVNFQRPYYDGRRRTMDGFWVHSRIYNDDIYPQKVDEWPLRLDKIESEVWFAGHRYLSRKEPTTIRRYRMLRK